MYGVRRLFPAVASAWITGIDEPTPISIVDGEYRTASTGWTSSPGLVLNDEVVYVRHVASAGFDAATTTTLSVGGVAASFTTRTIRRSAFTSGAVRDFNGDGHPDMIWRNEATGDATVWLLDDAFRIDGRILDGRTLLAQRLDWTPTHFGDFNGDGTTDIVWHNAASGETALWLVRDGVLAQGAIVMADADWSVTHVADFDGDGKSDLLWRNVATGTTAMWVMDGLQLRTGALLVLNSDWRVALTADLDGDGRVDLVWHSPTLGNAAWLVNGTAMIAGSPLPAGSEFEPRLAPDLDGDRKDDIVWYRPSTNEIFGWLMDGLAYRDGSYFGAYGIPVATGDFDGDGKIDVVYEYRWSDGFITALYDGLRELFWFFQSQSLFRSFADLDGDGRADTVFLYTGSSPQTTSIFFRACAYFVPCASYGAALVADPNWRPL